MGVENRPGERRPIRELPIGERPHERLNLNGADALSELTEIQGIGEARAARIKASLELGRRMVIAVPENQLRIHSPADAVDFLSANMAHLEQEHMRLLLLNARNRVIRSPTIYIGNVSQAVVQVSKIFKHAIRESAAALIVAHNHPSGDPFP